MKYFYYTTIVLFCFVSLSKGETLELNIQKALQEDSKCRQYRNSIEALEIANFKIKLQLQELEREINLNKNRHDMTSEMYVNAAKVHRGYLTHTHNIEKNERDKLYNKERFYEYIVHPMPEDYEVSIPAAKTKAWTLIADGKEPWSKMEHLSGRTGLLKGLTLFKSATAYTQTAIYLLVLQKIDNKHHFIKSITTLEIFPHETYLCEKIFEKPLELNKDETIAILLPPNTAMINGIKTKNNKGDYFMTLDAKKIKKIQKLIQDPSNKKTVILPLDYKSARRTHNFTFSLFGSVLE